MTRPPHRRRRPSVWTVIALLLFIAALTLWIVVRPNDADQDNQPISPLPIATSSMQSPSSEI
jgi:hypothetical protein